MTLEPLERRGQVVGVPPADAVAQTAGTVALAVVAALLLLRTTGRVRSRTAPPPG
ncbi:hypothetical protein [Pseudonocardia sp. T1-2H]|uniref:hypothetical protein n=1 Tax=Pseudonocardia sp. T1-2H TaxID=3128899 RepID=UPI0031010456